MPLCHRGSPLGFRGHGTDVSGGQPTKLAMPESCARAHSTVPKPVCPVHEESEAHGEEAGWGRVRAQVCGSHCPELPVPGPRPHGRATCQTLSAVPPPGAEAVTGTGSGVLCLFGRRGSCHLLPGVPPRGSAGSSSRSHGTADPSASQPRVRVSRVLTSFAAGGRHCRDGLSDGAEAAAGPTSGGAQRPREPATRPQRLGLGAPGPVPGCAQDAW